MTMRGMMVGVFGVVVGSILSILVVQYFGHDKSPRSTTPPDPLTVDPQHAVEQTKKLP